MEDNKDENINSSKKSSTYEAEGEPDISAAESASSNAPPDYTKEQHEVVQTILKCKDNYYEVLGVTRSCTDDELQKARRELARKVHPDKNNAPGATEACQAINNAFNTLSDPKERRRYDDAENERNAQDQQHEAQDQQHEAQDQQHEAQDQQHEAQDQQHEAQDQQHEAQDQQQKLNPFITLLLILGAVVTGLLLKWFAEEDPAYSLQQTSKYVIRRTTRRLSVLYFVKRDFLRCHGDEIAQIEQQVEKELLDFLDQLEEERLHHRMQN